MMNYMSFNSGWIRPHSGPFLSIRCGDPSVALRSARRILEIRRVSPSSHRRGRSGVVLISLPAAAASGSGAARHHKSGRAYTASRAEVDAQWRSLGISPSSEILPLFCRHCSTGAITRGWPPRGPPRKREKDVNLWMAIGACVLIYTRCTQRYRRVVR